MPNWVDNRLTITGEPEDIIKIKAQLSEPYTVKQKDWLTNEVTDFLNESPLSFWNIIRPPADKLDEYHAPHGWADGKESGNTNYNWYNFNNREWGCKWDAGDAQMYEDTEGAVSYSFNTPWAPPMSAILKLSEQYPQVTMWLKYEEEQGWGGVERFNGGESECEEAWDIPESHADNKAIDRTCICEYHDDQEDWYEDCPRETASIG